MDLPVHAVDNYIAHINAACARSADARTTTHVIFAHGTVVVIDDDPLPTDALPFTRAYLDEWPVERLEKPNDLCDHIADNAVTYAAACAKWGTAYPYAAITALINAGYLAPGPAATRAVSTTADSTLHIVTYADERASSLLNIIDGSVPHETALILGAEYRRLDWMFPQVAEIIRAQV